MVRYVVNASLGENGRITGGQPGDQTGREVRVQTWYDRPWNLMLRYPNASLGVQASDIAAALANSNLVGYNQNSRMSLYNRLRDYYNFDVNAYIASGDLTNVDCSSFVYTCWACVLPSIRYNGSAPSTSEMYDAYTDWGFTAYRQQMYLDSPDYLLAGDLLVYEGHHTVIAYETAGPGPDPPDPTGELLLKKNIESSIGADYFDRSLAGEYIADTDVYIRNGPSILRKALAVIPENSKVYNFGYYSGSIKNPWLYCQVKLGDTIYTGHVKGKYLIKVK